MKNRFRALFPEIERELGFFPTGAKNAITDVRGVEVGHVTRCDPRNGLQTGVTAIWPRRDVYHFRPRASGHVLHGAGEMTGLHQALEWGMIETPILLTSTLNVGRVYDGVIAYMARKHPLMGTREDVLIPVVAECDDSHLSLARKRPIGAREVTKALNSARSGAVAEGSVGAGTGMISFDLKAGIGTSSRLIRVGKGRASREFTLGALVNANVGIERQLRVAGRPVGRGLLRSSAATSKRPPNAERSIIVILATDAPMRPDQLRRLSVRAGLGLGRAGSFAGHGSGELVLAFTTTLGESRSPSSPKSRPPSPISRVENLRDDALAPFYEATVECVEECLLNALVANSAETLGRDGHRARAVPLEAIRAEFTQGNLGGAPSRARSRRYS